MNRSGCARQAAKQWPRIAAHSSRQGFTPAALPLGRINALITRNAEQGHLAKCLQLAKELRDSASTTEKPNLETYEALARAFAVHGLYKESLRLVDDAEAYGIKPDTGVWNQVLKAHVIADIPVSQALTRMQAAQVEGNQLTTHLIVQQCVHQSNLEGSLRAILPPSRPSSSRSASTLSVPPDLSHVPLQTISSIIGLACGLGETRVAADLIGTYERTTSRQIPDEIFISLMSACVDNSDTTGARLGLQRMMQQRFPIDEGLGLALANLFSRHSPEYLVECEQVSLTCLFPAAAQPFLSEWHVSPLISAYMSAGRIEEAVACFQDLLNRTKKTSYAPLMSSRWRKMFSEGLRSPEQIKAGVKWLQDHLEGQRETALQLPIHFINGILEACNVSNLRDEAARIMELLFSSDPHPRLPEADISTFNILLDGCRTKPRTWVFYSAEPGPQSHEQDRPAYGNIALAEAILEDLHSERYAKLTPNKRTYETIIEIYLSAAPDEKHTWESAFEYLEEMKHFDYLPSPFVYVGFLNRLLDERNKLDIREDPRIDLVLKEMAALGYLGGERKSGSEARMIVSRSLRARIGEDAFVRAREGAYRGRSSNREGNSPRRGKRTTA